MVSFSDAFKNFLNNIKCNSDCCDKHTVIIQNASGIRVDITNPTEDPTILKDDNTQTTPQNNKPNE